MRTGVHFEVSDEQRERLEAIAADGKSQMKHVRRARVILLTDDGLGTMAVAADAGVTKATVWRWQKRFMEEDVDGLLRDKTRKPGGGGSAVRGEGSQAGGSCAAPSAGGIAMLKSIAGPFLNSGVRFNPTGGISEKTLSDWLAMPSVFAVGGTWIAPRKEIASRNWRLIAANARKAVAAANACRGRA